jgi:hypothetical protein
MCGSRLLAALALIVGLTVAPQAAGATTDQWSDKLHAVHAHGASAAASDGPRKAVANNFLVLGHHDLGELDTNGDVFVHGNFAYVGTWQDPCNGRGVKIIDVSDLRHPQLIGTLAARAGTSAEDMVVRRVTTSHFSGDLLAVGIQRCGDDAALDDQQFGVELWDVTDPYAPLKLGELGAATGGGGVHELDLFSRGGNVYALLAVPFSEWFDPFPAGDFRIVDVTNPRAPVQVGDWGAGANGFSPGPFFGQGSFGATFAHSARASADGTKAYVSYWDLGVLTFDITDVARPVLLSRTHFDAGADGDAHSVSEYNGRQGRFLLQNDEDFDPTTPATISYRARRGGVEHALGNESPSGPPLWLEPGHQVHGNVVQAADQGCSPSDYPAGTAGKIAVVRTPFPFFDPFGGEEPLCLQQTQEAAAEAAGATAVVHDFVSEATSPQWFDFGSVGIPVLFTDHTTAQAMVAAGRAKLKANKPSWGFLRIFDAATGRQVAKFDDVPHVQELPAPDGFWSIHNNELVGQRSFVSWYSNGIVALDISTLDRPSPGDPKLVGQFVPPAAEGHVPEVWGVAIRPSDNVIFASDMSSGLWILQATGRAAP